MTRLDSPERICAVCAHDLSESLAQRGRNSFRFRAIINGLKYTIGVRQAEEDFDSSLDLPENLRTSQPALRRVYRALRDLRESRGQDASVRPADIFDYLKQDDPDGDGLAQSTIDHALADLLKRDVIYRLSGRGWLVGSRQLKLPNSARQSDTPAPSGIVAYALDMADAGVRGFTNRRAIVPKPIMWVPGEKTEYGVVVVDAVTEAAVLVSERVGEMRVPTKTGKLSRVDAAKAELVREDGKYAVVKFGKQEMRVRVLGDWHLKGLSEPESTTVA